MLLIFLLELVFEFHPDLGLLTVHQKFVHLVHMLFKQRNSAFESRHLLGLYTLRYLVGYLFCLFCIPKRVLGLGVVVNRG